MAATRPRKQAPRRWRPLRRLRGWWAVLIVGAGALIVVVGLVVAGNLTRGSGDIPERTAEAEGRTLGSPDAPLTIVEYSDFQCPVCARAARELMPQVEESFITGGLVKLEYRHFAFIGQESVWAAEASECAREQDRFWDYHDKLFTSQGGENRGAFSIANLKRFARELGLGQAAFDACLDSHRYVSAVQQQTDEGRRDGVEATPTYFVGDTKIQGLKPYDEFEKAIEKELRSR